MAANEESFSAEELRAFAEVEQITIQVGHNRHQHRALGIWAVVVDGQVYIRSWTGNPQGWYGIVKAEPVVTVEAGQFKLDARAVPVAEATINDAISQAYHQKYDATWPTYATDMTKPGPVATTIQLLPAK